MAVIILWSLASMESLAACLPDERDAYGRPTWAEWMAAVDPVLHVELGERWDEQPATYSPHPDYRSLIRAMPALGLSWSVEAHRVRAGGEVFVRVLLAEVEVWPREWGLGESADS